MAKNIYDTEEYKDFDAKHNRHLNMMQDTVSIAIVFYSNLVQSYSIGP